LTLMLTGFMSSLSPEKDFLLQSRQCCLNETGSHRQAHTAIGNFSEDNDDANPVIFMLCICKTLFSFYL
jgi:hypothetical protein